jgi:nucleoid-associated protein YgaU
MQAMPLPKLPEIASQADAAGGAAGDSKVARAEAAQIPSDISAGAGVSPEAAAGLAQAEVLKAQARTGLSDAQLEQLQQAQDQLAAGDSGSAFVMLQGLNAQLQTETRSYVVQQGESLWHVAGQREVYGNPYLWPLVWQANKDRLKQPYQLHQGMHLMIPAHPTIQEVSSALAFSRSRHPEVMRPAAAR